MKASVYIAIAPYFELGTLFLTLPKIERFRTPGLYVVASEDTVMAGLGGNQLIVEDFERQAPPAWLVELKDAGHFSFADDCELVEEFGACCGTGTRTTGRAEEYSYVETKLARDVAARYTTLFFAAQLQVHRQPHSTSPCRPKASCSRSMARRVRLHSAALAARLPSRLSG